MENGALVDVNYALQQIEIGENESGGQFQTDSSHIKDFLNALPTVEAAPVVHGEWKLDRYATEWTCSNCEGEMLYKVTTYGGGQYHDLDNIFPPYCPHCGAKMDLEE